MAIIRTGIRPSLKLSLDMPATDQGYRRVMPFRRSWVAIAFLAAMDMIFLVPAMGAFKTAVTQWGQINDLFDLVGALFMTAWLIGWSTAPLIMTTILLLMLFGREVLRVGRTSLEILIGLPFIGVVAKYDLSHVRNLRLVEPAPRSGKSWRGPHIEFDYGAAPVALGSDMTVADQAEIRAALESSTGAALRSGEATEEELATPLEDLPVEFEQMAPAASQAAPGAGQALTLASPSTLALIIANLVPVAGSVFFGWQLADVMVLYWAESAIIGFYNLCKMAVIGKWLALPMGLFFLGHFGAFMAGHFLFLYAFFVDGHQNMSGGALPEVAALFVALWPAMLALFISHGFSFYRNFFGQKEYRDRTLNQQMTEPYSRIIFMHLVLIFGGGLSMLLGDSAPVLLLVIALKIIFDVKAHLKEHEKKE